MIGNDPGRWPHRWVLPVTRIGGDPIYNPQDCGLVTHAHGVVRPVVYIANLFDVSGPESLARAPKEEYGDLDTLFQQWRVD